MSILNHCTKISGWWVNHVGPKTGQDGKKNAQISGKAGKVLGRKRPMVANQVRLLFGAILPKPKKKQADVVVKVVASLYLSYRWFLSVLRYEIGVTYGCVTHGGVTYGCVTNG